MSNSYSMKRRRIIPSNKQRSWPSHSMNYFARAAFKMAKKSKIDGVDFTVDHSAASLAESWLDEMIKSDQTTEDAETPQDQSIKQPRPSRMGLGAKYVPHSKLQSGKAVSDCLAKNKKRSAPDVIFRSKALAESDDENESRTKTIQKKSKTNISQPEKSKKQLEVVEKINFNSGVKEKKCKKKKVEKEALPVEVDHDTAGSGNVDEALIKSKITDLVNTTNISAERAEELACRPPRRRRIKGKKTRSKQKNIRKDNRPEHLKPGFQNPPTL